MSNLAKQSNVVPIPPKTAESERVVMLAYLQSAITAGHMHLQGVTTLGSPNTNSGPDKMLIVKVDGGIELRSPLGSAFIPDGNIKIVAYK